MTAQKTPTAGHKAPAASAHLRLSRLEELGLSNMFRPGSTSRKAAELLLSGEPITKAELIRRTGVVETVVPRTINWLRKAGIEIERSQDPKTKQATYCAVLPVVDRAPDGSFEFHTQGPAVIVKLIIEAGLYPAPAGDAARGTVLTATLGSELGTVTASVPMSPLLSTLASEGLTLSRVILLPGGEQEWMLGFLPNTLLASNITYLQV
jgi:hypothetical protein